MRRRKRKRGRYDADFAGRVDWQRREYQQLSLCGDEEKGKKKRKGGAVPLG